MKRRAIIIGAGVGGLATAMRLAASGTFEVTVLEKNPTFGGRCNIREDGGYRFDTGPSLLLMPDVYRELFAACGGDFDAAVPLVKLDPNYRIWYSDNTQLDLSPDFDTTARNVDQLEPGAGAAYRRFLDDAQQKYRLGRSKFVEKRFDRARDFFTLPNLKLLKQLDALPSLYNHVSRFFKDERLRQAFSMQSMYLGMSPYDAPAVYALLPYTELAEDGLYYPKHGMYALAQAMHDRAAALGVTFHMNAEVERITTDGTRATGVVCNSSTMEADVVISNADLPYTYTDLLPRTKNALHDEAHWERQPFTSSAIVLHLGVEAPLESLLHHNFFLSSSFQRNFEELFNAKVAPRDPAFYVNIPTKTDPSAAPPGCHSVFILIPVPHLTQQQRWPDREIAAVTEHVLNTLEQRAAPGLRAAIRQQHVVSPHDWNQDYNLKYGAAFGLSHGIFQVGYFRPANKSAELANLYFVGASTAPGTGVPLVCIGARLVTERILADAS